MEELSALAAQGKPVYGHSDLPEYIQGVAHRNSVWSQLVSKTSSLNLSVLSLNLFTTPEIRCTTMVQPCQVSLLKYK